MARPYRWVRGPRHCTVCRSLWKRSGRLRMVGWGWDRGTGRRRNLVGRRSRGYYKLPRRRLRIPHQSFSIDCESQDNVCHDYLFMYSSCRSGISFFYSSKLSHQHLCCAQVASQEHTGRCGIRHVKRRLVGPSTIISHLSSAH